MRDVQRSLIINADDLGISAPVNEAIFELMSVKLVTSATVMANGAALDQALVHAQKFPRCSFGVHLTLTCGRPLAPTAALAPLLDDEGNFGTRLFTLAVPPALSRAIAHEFTAQIDALQARGLSISHLDSHEHVHTLPGVFKAFKSVQRRFGIRRARLTKNLYCQSMEPATPILMAKKAVWNAALRYYYRTRTTRWFSDLYSVIRAARERPLGSGIIEAMVHPGAVDDPIMLQELADLRAGALDGLPFPVRLTSYHSV